MARSSNAWFVGSLASMQINEQFPSRACILAEEKRSNPNVRETFVLVMDTETDL